MSQMYEVSIVASGEVRDAEGNLVETVPIETTLVVTEEEAQEMGLLDQEEKQ